MLMIQVNNDCVGFANCSQDIFVRSKKTLGKKTLKKKSKHILTIPKAHFHCLIPPRHPRNPTRKTTPPKPIRT